MKKTKNEKSRIKIEKTNIKPDFNVCYTKLKTSGNVLEVTATTSQALGAPCRRLSATKYLNLTDGSIYEYRAITDRSESLRGIKNTLKGIRDLINCNVIDEKKLLWLTLTYKENMTDTKKLYSDYEKFWKKMLRYFKKQNIEKPEYISVIEPQARGAWHCHVFFIWQDCNAPFIENSKLAEIWGHGFTKTKAVKNCDNIGAYFSAYLADIPLNELENVPEGSDIQLKQTIDEQGIVTSKAIAKGSRLAFYPPKMNILRYSRGCKKPVIEELPYFEIQKKVGSAQPTFEQSFKISDEDGKTLNIVSKAYYNKKKQ